MTRTKVARMTGMTHSIVQYSDIDLLRRANDSDPAKVKASHFLKKKGKPAPRWGDPGHSSTFKKLLTLFENLFATIKSNTVNTLYEPTFNFAV